MNNYQVQQLNDTIAFVTSIMALGFVAIMVSQTFNSEQPKRIWLVYVTPEGKWGAWDISPHKPTLAIHKEDPKKYLKEWGEYYYLDAEAQVQRGRFANYWISEATTRYRAIKNVQVMALPEYRSSRFIMYHATPASNVQSVLEKGILPVMPPHKPWAPVEPVVYIANSIERVKDYAEQAWWYGESHETNWAVFKIEYDEFPEEIYPDLMWGVPGTYYTKIGIPSEHICLVSIYNVSTGEQKEIGQ